MHKDYLRIEKQLPKFKNGEILGIVPYAGICMLIDSIDCGIDTIIHTIDQIWFVLIPNELYLCYEYAKEEIVCDCYSILLFGIYLLKPEVVCSFILANNKSLEVREHFSRVITNSKNEELLPKTTETINHRGH